MWGSARLAEAANVGLILPFDSSKLAVESFLNTPTVNVELGDHWGGATGSWSARLYGSPVNQPYRRYGFYLSMMLQSPKNESLTRSWPVRASCWLSSVRMCFQEAGCGSDFSFGYTRVISL